MNDDRLISALGALRGERMDRAADQALRSRLENAWSVRERQSGLAWQLRRPALALATVALAIGLGSATLNAAGDSPLYALRVTVENLAVPLHLDTEGRIAYLMWLLEERAAEAARLEASGNALAAGRVRAIEQETLRALNAQLPVAPEPEQTVALTPSPTPSPTEAPTPTPSPSPSPTAEPTATPHPATPRPTATPTPKPPTPKPTVTGAPMAVTISGKVKNPDGTLAKDVCVTVSLGGPCLIKTAIDGTYRVTVSARLNQSFTLYFMKTDVTTNITYKGSVTVAIKGAFVEAGITTLRRV